MAVAAAERTGVGRGSPGRSFERLWAAYAVSTFGTWIAFAVTRPRRMTLNEILVRPTAQER